jgi:hypothetical protein
MHCSDAWALLPRDLVRQGSTLLSIAFAIVSAGLGPAGAAEPSEIKTLYIEKNRCEDAVAGRVSVVPELSAPFFASKKASYPWRFVDHGDGTLEDTFGGPRLKKKNVKKIEHTAACISSHQGPHEMNFCRAELRGEELHLWIDSGLPAYASALDIVIEKDTFRCAYEAVYPAGPPPSWRITKKELRARKLSPKAGERFFAWVSVEFDELVKVDGETRSRPFKVEGFIKPIVEKPKAHK